MEKPNLDPFLRHLPNRITLLRVAVIPAILILYTIDLSFIRFICAMLFAAAALSDILDGYLARKYGAESSLGALLDPLADKMLVAAALLILVYAHNLFPLLAGLLLCRDIAVSGIRLLAMDKNIQIPVSIYGKLKTIFQDIGIFCLMINQDFLGLPMHGIGMIVIWIALGLSLFSGYQYFQAFWSKVKL